MPCSRDVVIGMVAYAVSSPPHFFEQVRILHGIVSHHEEGGLCSEAVQHIEDEGRSFGDRSVVEGQIDHLPVLVNPP